MSQNIEKTYNSANDGFELGFARGRIFRGAGTGGAEGAAAPPVFFLWTTVNCCE